MTITLVSYRFSEPEARHDSEKAFWRFGGGKVFASNRDYTSQIVSSSFWLRVSNVKTD